MVSSFSKRQVITIFLVCILLVFIGYALKEAALDRLDRARWPARRSRAYTLGKELIYETNSAMLEGITPEFRKDLSAFLNTPEYAWVNGRTGFPFPGDPRGTLWLGLTNEYEHQGFVMHLQQAENFKFRLLSYSRLTN